MKKITMKNDKERAKELLAKMTLTEKVGQLAQNFYGFNAYTRNENNEIVLTDEFKAYVQRFGGIGMLNNYFRSDPWCKKNYATGGITVSEREKAYNILQKYIIENTRLGIPVLIEEDAPHGRQVLDSILYPVSLNVGCSFDPILYQEQAKEIGTEAKLGGVYVPYLSVLDMALDPRWGRFEECFSEDPYLASQMSASAVRGMNESENMVCCKHFAAQGGAVGGHNGGVTVIGERELREIHLPAAEAAVKEGCDFIMAAYNEIDGMPCHANGYLLNDILRGEFEFDGVVRSDGCAVSMLSEFCRGDLAQAGAVAVKSGVDCGLWDDAMTRLVEAVEKGYITEQEIDVAVLRLLEKKFKCGVMDKPYLDENGASESYVRSGKGQGVAYRMATESLVLLKNENTLPLQAEKNVLLVGGNAENVYYMLGDYTSERKAPVNLKDIFTEHGASFLQGWTFEDGVTATDEQIENAVKKADVIVFCCGGSSVRDFESKYNAAGAVIQASKKYMDCGEGQDLAELKLAPCQIECLKKLAGFGKPIVSVVIAGRAYVLTELAELSTALVWCGYPGQEGAKAVFDTLYGKVNNFGRLSVSFPKSVGQLPIVYNQRFFRPYVDIDDKALYPFGYGLSYSEFSYYNFEMESVSLSELQQGKSVKVSVKVKNISNRKGKEVVQFYIRRLGGTITHRKKELKGFEKIELQPNEEKRISFFLGKEELKEWSARKQYELFPMRLTVMIGKSSEEIVFEQTIDVL